MESRTYDGRIYSPSVLTRRQIRRLYHHTLHVNKSAEYVPYQELENKQMLHDILQDQGDVFIHLRRYSTSLTTSIVYG
jgi:hypothetical protein